MKPTRWRWPGSGATRSPTPSPNGEPVADFDRRVGQAWGALLERHHGRHVLLVVHGGTIRMVLRRLLDMPVRRIWRFEVPFACVSRIRLHRDPEAEPHLAFQTAAWHDSRFRPGPATADPAAGSVLQYAAAIPGVGAVGAVLSSSRTCSIGALLAGLHTALWLIDPGVLAALMLAVWVIITGGLHLDGLADTADAWIGGRGDRDRTLAIMKDSRSGPIAIIAIVLVLLNKFAALQVLLAGDARAVLLLAPVLGRATIVLLLITTPYVRPHGLGRPYANYLPRLSCGLLVRTGRHGHRVPAGMAGGRAAHRAGCRIFRVCVAGCY